MNNSFFASLGMGNIDIGIILIVLATIILLLIILNIVNICSIRKLKKRYDIFMQGKNVKSLESEIIGLFEDNKFIKILLRRIKRIFRHFIKNLNLLFKKLA